MIKWNEDPFFLLIDVEVILRREGLIQACTRDYLALVVLLHSLNHTLY